eukprot:NODE_284_length_10808_cov_1.215613.p1 type:complete len:1743 gc:universal NODE_284_length_10808_cov_1.215613:211-5439(+)
MKRLLFSKETLISSVTPTFFILKKKATKKNHKRPAKRILQLSNFFKNFNSQLFWITKKCPDQRDLLCTFCDQSQDLMLSDDQSDLETGATNRTTDLVNLLNSKISPWTMESLPRIDTSTKKALEAYKKGIIGVNMAHFFVLNVPIYGKDEDGYVDTLPLKRICAKIAKIKDRQIPRIEFIYNNSILEVILPKRNEDAVKTAFAALKYNPEFSEYSQIEILSRSDWISHFKSTEISELKKECRRIGNSVAKLAYLIKQSDKDTKYKNDVSDKLLKLAKQLDKNFEPDQFLVLVKKHIKVVNSKNLNLDLNFSKNSGERAAINPLLQSLFHPSNDATMDNDHNSDQNSLNDDSPVTPISQTAQDLLSQKQVRSTRNEIDTLNMGQFQLTINGNSQIQHLDRQISIRNLLDLHQCEHYLFNLECGFDLNTIVTPGASIILFNNNVDVRSIGCNIFGKKTTILAPREFSFHQLLPLNLHSNFESTHIIKINHIQIHHDFIQTTAIDHIEITLLNFSNYLSSFSYDNSQSGINIIFKYFQLPSKCMYTQSADWFSFIAELSSKFKLDLGSLNIYQNGILQLNNFKIQNDDQIFVTGKQLGGSKYNLRTRKSTFYNSKIQIDLSTIKQNVHTSIQLDVSRIGYYNIDGLRSKYSTICPIMENNNIDLLFLSETKLGKHNSIGQPIVFHTDTVNNQYGMALALHPKYIHRNISIQSSSSYHINIDIDELNILAIYIPHKIKDKFKFYQEHFVKYINENTYLIGDFNVALKNDSLPITNLFKSDLFRKQLIYHDIPDTMFTFYRETRNGIETTQPDHLIIPLDPKRKVVNSGTILFPISYHCLLYFDISVTQIPLLPKNPKIRSYKLSEEQINFEFQHNLDLELIKSRTTFLSLVDKPQDFLNSLSVDKKLEIANESYLILQNICVKSAKMAAGMTQAIPTELNNDLFNLGQELLTNYNSTTKLKVKRYQKSFLELNKERHNRLDDSEFIKQLKYRRRRKFNKDTMMDYRKLDQYIDLLKFKWNTGESVDLNCNFPCSTDSFRFSTDDLNNALKSLPKGKSSGPDNIDSEMLRNASNSFKEMLLKFFNLCLVMGITPDLLKCSDLIGLYKKGDGTDFVNHYRYIGISSQVKKLFCKMISNEIYNIFMPSHRQYGYQPNLSVSDCVFDVNAEIERLENANIKFKVHQLDVKSAFDKLDRTSIYNFLTSANCSIMFKQIIWELCRSQNIRLRLGQFTSKYVSTNQGVTQGDVLSPKLFSIMLDLCFVDWDESRGKIFIFADDLLFIEILSDHSVSANVIDEFNQRLSTIGLELSMEKCETLGENYSKYLGYQICNRGIDMNQQIKINLKNAHHKVRELGKLGVFKNTVSVSKLMRCLGSSVLPTLEFGLQIWNPDPKDCKKIDKFLKDTIRNYSGAGRMTALPDLYEIYNFTEYFYRWQSRHISWNNHLSHRNGTLDIVYNEKISYSFKPHKKLKDLNQNYPGLTRLLNRQVPLKPIRCPICKLEHKVANGSVLCFKNFIQSLNSLCETPQCHQLTRLDIDMYLLNNQSELVSNIPNRVTHIYTDGSLVNSSATCAYLIIQNGGCKIKSANISHLNVKSSTRAEIIGVIYAMNDSELNLQNEIIVHSDSKSAIASIENFQNGKNYAKIQCGDLLVQSKLMHKSVQMKWVKAHSGVVGNEICDKLCCLDSEIDASLEMMISENSRIAMDSFANIARINGHFLHKLNETIRWSDAKQALIRNNINSLLKEYFNE